MQNYPLDPKKPRIYQGKIGGDMAPDLTQPNGPTRGKGRPRVTETAAPSLVDLLNLIRLDEPTTRQDLERKSELGRAIVADRLAMLADLGLIDESELGTATGGRAPRLIRLAARRGRLLVATLDQTALGVGVADLAGTLLTEHHEAFELTAPPQALAERLTTLLRWSLDRQASPAGLWGISLSVPGTVPGAMGDFLTRTPAALPAWEGFPLVEMLTRSFGVPVWMRSSVETMTMGELHGGAGQGLGSLLFIKVGRRIGAGIVNEGRLLRGAQGATGLIGALPVHLGDRSGTLDAIAGSDMILREGRTAAETGRSAFLADQLRRGGEITAIDVAQAAQMGDAACVEILTTSGRLIGQVVATLTNTLNPEVIILSGAIVQTNDIILAAVREAVYGASHPLVTRDLRIIRSQMGSSAGLVGAARAGTELLFAPQFLKDWVMQGTPLKHSAFLSFRDDLEAAPPPPAPSPPSRGLP
jgi:predicted NBD/HSP70 family sugar kinase